LAKLRIYADFNSCTVDGWCYCLRVDGRELNDVAAELGVYEGMPVVVFYEDCADEFEFDGVLSFRSSLPLSGPEWVAIVDESTFRRIR
jgi:hypothetical protein